MSVPIKTLNDQTKIPLLGLGTWQLEGKACTEAIKMALEIGYRHIDTAFAYYNQKQIAKAIKGFDREKLFITTKLWFDRMRPEFVEEECDTCLRELQVDYVDLYIVHWPDHTYLPQTVEALFKLKEKGKIKSVGVSNSTIHHLQDLLDEDLFVSVNQVEFHPYLNQKELLSFCDKHKIAIEAYSPIAHGKVSKDKKIQKVADKYKKSASQTSLRWLVQKGMIVIPKGSSRKHLLENFSIFDFELSKEDMLFFDNLSKKTYERQIEPEFSEFDY